MKVLLLNVIFIAPRLCRPSAVPTCFNVEVLDSMLQEELPWLILSLGVSVVTSVLGAKFIFMQNSHRSKVHEALPRRPPNDCWDLGI